MWKMRRLIQILPSQKGILPDCPDWGNTPDYHYFCELHPAILFRITRLLGINVAVLF